MWISKNKLEVMKREAFLAGRKDLEAKNENLWDSYNKVESARIEVQKKYDDLIQKLHTQSENDMIAEAVKLIFKGIKGEEKVALQPHYNQMLAAQQQMNDFSNYAGPYGSLDFLGIGNIFAAR